MLSSAFGDRISTALSGGYDSRLMLALLRACGVAPYVYVYGYEDDCDVQVARSIAAGEGFALVHTDKQAGAPIGVGRIRRDRRRQSALLRRTLVCRRLRRRRRRAHAPRALPARRAHAQRQRSAICIAGRTWPTGRFDALEVVWRYYCGFDPAVCTESFSAAGVLRRAGRASSSAHCARRSPVACRRHLDRFRPSMRATGRAARSASTTG